MNQVKQIHAFTLRNGIDHTNILISKLIQIPNLPYAQAFFNLIPKPSVFLYNKLIQACSSHGQHHQSLYFYSQMCSHGCPPNQHSFTFLFAACAALPSSRHAQILHAHFVKSGFESDVFALTALVDMYAKLGMLVFARQVFDEMSARDIPAWNSMVAGYARSGNMDGALELFSSMPCKNVISWTAMISGYSQNGDYAKALEMFFRMEKAKDIEPNEVTIASILPACAHLGALEIGRRIEAYARKKGFFKNLYVSNAILEMHARCGNINVARQVFDDIGGNRNLCSWNSMIMGLALHGRCREALALYDRMLVGQSFLPIFL